MVVVLRRRCAEEPVTAARLHGEVQAVDGVERAVAAGQVFEFNNGEFIFEMQNAKCRMQNAKCGGGRLFVYSSFCLGLNAADGDFLFILNSPFCILHFSILHSLFVSK